MIKKQSNIVAFKQKRKICVSNAKSVRPGGSFSSGRLSTGKKLKSANSEESNQSNNQACLSDAKFQDFS